MMTLRVGSDNALSSENACAKNAKMKDAKFAEHLSVFVDVVKGGSFSDAARRRSVTPSAVVRQIDGLEQALDAMLFVRSTRALTLTDAGERLFERAQHLLDDLADVQSEITALNGAVAGVLRIACFPTFGKRYVIPVLAKLMTDHPALTIELDLTERLADPVQERLDAVIRIGSLDDSRMIVAKIADQRRLLVASGTYLDQFGTPASVEDLKTHRLIDKLHGADLLGWADVLGQSIRGATARADVFRCDDFEALRAAAVAGMGIAFLPSWVVGPDVGAGPLERLTLAGESWNARMAGIYVLRAPVKLSAKLKMFITALRSHIGSSPIWDEGLLLPTL